MSATDLTCPIELDSPSLSSHPLHNSRDCKAYLLSLPSGDVALQHAIKQAKQGVHSQAGPGVLHTFSFLHLA